MARIELRDTTITVKDGLSGVANVTEATPGASDTDVDIGKPVLNSAVTWQVPIGARFKVSTAGNVTKYTVTARTASTGVDEVQTLSGSGATAGTFALSISTYGEAVAPDVLAIPFDAAPAAIQTLVDTAMAAVGTYVAGDIVVSGATTADLGDTIFTFSGTSVENKDHPMMVVDGSGLTGGGTEAVAETTPGEFVGQTTNIVFTPAWGTIPPVVSDVITFQANEVEVKIGDGNLTYTENKEYEYELDRGVLDTVKEGDEQPMDVSIDFVYEFVTTGTGEAISVVDALKGIGGASEFVSASSDLCEPYCVDIEIDHNPSCGATQKEITTFPDYRYDSLEFDLSEATIATTGRCNATQPTITRATAT
ncbi:MAG: hypothetical protein ACYS7Y_32345 [Planctomycetota bacterium]|jgi:hypothetical protein